MYKESAMKELEKIGRGSATITYVYCYGSDYTFCGERYFIKIPKISNSESFSEMQEENSKNISEKFEIQAELKKEKRLERRSKLNGNSKIHATHARSLKNKIERRK